MKYFISIFLFLLAVASAQGESHESPDINQFPGLISRVRISGPLDFCGEAVELENQEIGRAHV